jgi:hypothetical protein
MIKPMKRTSTDTLITALRVLARDVQSEDGVANSCLREAADRMEELNQVVDQATNVVKAASRGDQEFIDCLRRREESTTKLRLSIVALGDKLRDL